MSRLPINPKQTAWYFPLVLAPLLRLEVGLTVRRTPKVPSLPPGAPAIEVTSEPVETSRPGLARCLPDNVIALPRRRVRSA